MGEEILHRGAYDLRASNQREDERYISKVGGGRNMEAGKEMSLAEAESATGRPRHVLQIDSQLGVFLARVVPEIVPRAANWGFRTPESPPLTRSGQEPLFSGGGAPHPPPPLPSPPPP